MAIDLKEFFIHKLREQTEETPGAGATFSKVDPAAKGATPAFQVPAQQALQVGPESFTKFQTSLKELVASEPGEETMAMAQQADQAAEQAFAAIADPKAQADFMVDYQNKATKWAKQAGKYVELQKKLVDVNNELKGASQFGPPPTA